MSSFNDVTAILKTHNRPEALKKCIESLRRFYPLIKILVVDDSVKQRPGYASQVDQFYATDNRALSYGWNFGVEKAETTYVLIGDDDFVYTENSNLQALLDLMEVADIAGGATIFKGEMQHYEGTYSWDGKRKHMRMLPLEEKYLEHKGHQYQDTDFTANFFIAKRDAVLGGWEENIVMMYEHDDFFLQMFETDLKVAYCKEATVIHDTPAATQDYFKDRYENDYSKKVFFTKWGFERVTGVTGLDMLPVFNEDGAVMLRTYEEIATPVWPEWVTALQQEQQAARSCDPGSSPTDPDQSPSSAETLERGSHDYPGE